MVSYVSTHAPRKERYKPTRNNHRITLPRKLHGFHPRPMSTPPSHRRALLNIPQKYLPVAANTGKLRIVRRDGHVQHRVPVRLVFLDRGCGDRFRARVVGDRARQVYGAIGGSGQDIAACYTGECDGVDRASDRG